MMPGRVLPAVGYGCRVRRDRLDGVEVWRPGTAVRRTATSVLVGVGTTSDKTCRHTTLLGTSGPVELRQAMGHRRNRWHDDGHEVRRSLR